MKGSEELSDPISAALAKSSLSLCQWMDLFLPDTGKKGLWLSIVQYILQNCAQLLFFKRD